VNSLRRDKRRSQQQETNGQASNKNKH